MLVVPLDSQIYGYVTIYWSDVAVDSNILYRFVLNLVPPSIDRVP